MKSKKQKWPPGWAGRILKRRISDISKEHLQCCKQIEKLERTKQQLMRESAALLKVMQ